MRKNTLRFQNYKLSKIQWGFVASACHSLNIRTLNFRINPFKMSSKFMLLYFLFFIPRKIVMHTQQTSILHMQTSNQSISKLTGNLLACLINALPQFFRLVFIICYLKKTSEKVRDKISSNRNTTTAAF